MDQHIIDHAAAAIMAYLQRRPDSADTVEGIHQWWIDWQGQVEDPQVTLQALEQLEKDTQLERVRIGNRFLWRRPRSVE